MGVERAKYDEIAMTILELGELALLSYWMCIFIEYTWYDVSICQQAGLRHNTVKRACVQYWTDNKPGKSSFERYNYVVGWYTAYNY